MLPGYAIQNYQDLPATAKQGECYFVIGNLKWYVYDAGSWVESNKNDVEYFRNLTSQLDSRLKPVETEANKINGVVTGIQALSNDYYSFKNQVSTGNSPIKVVDSNGVENTGQPIVPPKVVMQYKVNPDRIVFSVVGYGNPEIIGGLPIQANSSPIEMNFTADFPGQQWINLNNNDMWIAIHNQTYNRYYSWRLMTLGSLVNNPNFAPPSR